MTREERIGLAVTVVVIIIAIYLTIIWYFLYEVPAQAYNGIIKPIPSVTVQPINPNSNSNQFLI
jgi:hypothetical protein